MKDSVEGKLYFINEKLFSEIQIVNEDILGKRILPEIKKWNQYFLF